MPYCTKCRRYQDTNQFLIKKNGNYYKTCRTCLPSEKSFRQTQYLESLLPVELQQEIIRPRQYGTFKFDPYTDLYIHH